MRDAPGEHARDVIDVLGDRRRPSTELPIGIRRSGRVIVLASRFRSGQYALVSQPADRRPGTWVGHEVPVLHSESDEPSGELIVLYAVLPRKGSA